MLIGYNPANGFIEFLFSDSEYLNRQFPNNSAKITNFWKIENHGLIEMFVDKKEFSDYMNYQLYKVDNGKIIKKIEEEIQIALKPKKTIQERVSEQVVFGDNKDITIKNLEERIKQLEIQLAER